MIHLIHLVFSMHELKELKHDSSYQKTLHHVSTDQCTLLEFAQLNCSNWCCNINDGILIGQQLRNSWVQYGDWCVEWHQYSIGMWFNDFMEWLSSLLGIDGTILTSLVGTCNFICCDIYLGITYFWCTLATVALSWKSCLAFWSQQSFSD